jgi:hypothetical protein
MTIPEAVQTWLNYTDKDIYSEEEGINLINARITIREALRSGFSLINLDEALTEIAHLINQKQIEYEKLKEKDNTSWSEMDYTKGYLDALVYIKTLFGGEP